LTPEALETLSSHPALRGPGQSERLRSVYFDTPDHQLRDHGLSVRVRETPRGFIQTVKRRSGAGRVVRDEWEVATTGPTPNAAAPHVRVRARGGRGATRAATRPHPPAPPRRPGRGRGAARRADPRRAEASRTPRGPATRTPGVKTAQKRGPPPQKTRQQGN